MTTRLSVWSGPRNVSTALMYAFAQRPDTTVVDEPLYGCYLAHTGAPHPGRDELVLHLETDPAKVVQDTLLGSYKTDVVMFKNMAHHLTQLDRSFLGELTNVLLTRDPAEMLPSLAENLPEIALRDTGLEEQVEILEASLADGHTPIVIEARQLLQEPERTLEKLCAAVEIPFTEAMLSWPAGPKTPDGIWAKYWYKNVHASTGFAPYQPKTAPFPDELKPLLDACNPLYERLKVYAL